MKALIKKESKILTSLIVLGVLLITSGTIYASAFNPVKNAEKAVAALYSEDREMLAENVDQKQIEQATALVGKIKDEGKKEKLSKEIFTAKLMIETRDSVDFLYTDPQNAVWTLKNGATQEQIDNAKDNIESCKKMGKEIFATDMEQLSAVAFNVFDTVKQANALIDSLYIDGSARTQLRPEASIDIYNQAIALLGGLADENLKNALANQVAGIGTAMNNHVATQQAQAVAQAQAPAGGGGGGYEPSYSGGGGDYYEPSYSGGYEPSYSGGNSSGGYVPTNTWEEENANGGTNHGEIGSGGLPPGVEIGGTPPWQQ
ncbi:MAG: hypothetical protein ACRCU3_08375 [Eubacteriaceae bacterium]